MDDIVGSPEELLANVMCGVEEEVDNVVFSRASEFNTGERLGSVYMFV